MSEASNVIPAKAGIQENELPEGWVTMPLENCAEILDSQRIPINSKERSVRVEGKSQEELYPYYGATGQVDCIDDYIFDGEYLLIGEDGAPFFDKSKNVAYVAKGKFWVNNHAHILNAIEGVTNNKYLLHYLNKFNYKDYVGGTTRLKLNQASLKQIPVPLAPHEQQKRIVAKIEELFSHIDAGIEALKKAKQLLKQYRQSVLKAAVTGELTKEWRETNKAKLEPASELLERILKERRQKWEEQQLEQFKAKGKMPKDDKWKKKYKEPKEPEVRVALKNPDVWELASVDQVAEVLLGKMLDKAKHTKGEKLPYLRNVNVRWGSIDTNDLLEMFFKDSELERYDLSTGDVLVCEGGEPGRAAVWEGGVTMKYQKALHRVRYYLPLIPQYLLYLLEYFASTGLLERYFTGSTIKHFTKESFITLPFPLPSLQEMETIVEMINKKVSSVRRLEDEIERQLLKADKNKQSILATAFSGNIN